MDILDDAWFTLRLSLRCPERVPTWDAILLTAASPQQEELFQLHLERAKSQGTLPASTLAMAVSDPQGQRVGSGAATLCALRALSNKLDSTGGTWKGRPISELRVLLLHTGGDSQRVPWANAIGKAFLPFPAQADPDGPSPTLFDHIFAISLHVVPAFGDAGGVFIMTGDVLPCFRATATTLPENGVCVVTVPATPDLASHHGVILSKLFSSEPVLVEDLLQKPSLDEMARKGAIGPSGEVLLDTGMFAVRGEACTALIGLALLEPDPVSSLMDSGQQLSLYEEMAGAWVLARHQWLLSRPLGKQLIESLGSNRLYHYCARDLTFLHFGTSSEVLDHLSLDQSGQVLHQHFSVLPYPLSSCEVAASAVVIASEISDGASVGKQSVIYNCSLGNGVHIGSRCLVMGIHMTESQTSSQKPGMVAVPDDSCLWEVPLRNASYNRITLCCGTRDNPKAPYGGPGSTFLGEAWETFLPKMGIQEEDLWGQEFISKCKNLWNAHLFPLGPPDERLSFSLWLLGAIEPSSKIAQDWRKCIRLSLADLHGETDFVRIHTETLTVHSKLAASLAKANIADGAMTRDFSKLSRRILEGESGIAICKELFNACSSVNTGDKEQAPGVPASRLYQVQADLARASGEEDRAVTLEAQALRAISAETEAVVRMNRTDDPASMSNLDQLAFSAPITTVLPVRLDISGGWSDTPPWSLERRGRVLNMAVLLDGAAPVGAKVCATLVPGICLSDDAGNKAVIKEFDDITMPLQPDDPFRLVKAALVVTGFAGGRSKIPLPEGVGLEIQTWSNVPRGSGLGTSSILAAAVVKSLLRLRGGDDWQSKAQIARLVLVLEQVMGSGGGWQDQVGGLYPGIKCTTGVPGQTQLQLNVEEISLPSSVIAELEQRMVVVFTGQVRQAVTVLEKVVRRYLQRDAVLIRSIGRLTGLAQQGQAHIHLGNLDKLGEVMSQTWKLNQELDPFCSNPGVDKLFRDLEHLTCGYKLAGAGGGGFGFLMAKDQDAAEAIKAKLQSHSVQVFHWTLAKEMTESP